VGAGAADMPPIWAGVWADAEAGTANSAAAARAVMAACVPKGLVGGLRG
jgi:hypothetical protein